jgi:hypothetical protein
VGALGCAYFFACSTVPVTTTGDPGLFGPPLVQTAAVVAGICLGLPSLLLPVVWLPIGVRCLRRGWRLAWLGGTAAAIGLEAGFLVGAGVPYMAPSYVGAPILSWIQLAQSAGYLITGVVLVAILLAAPA